MRQPARLSSRAEQSGPGRVGTNSALPRQAWHSNQSRSRGTEAGRSPSAIGTTTDLHAVCWPRLCTEVVGMSIADAPEFAALLRRFRVGAGLSPADLAQRVGLSARTVSDLERGDRVAHDPATVLAIAGALGLA